MKVIELRDVSKSYHLHADRMLLRQRLIHLLANTNARRFYALKNVSVHVNAGEGVAILGSNGAGKSTLLSLVCGLSRADSGSVAVEGRVAPLLELGSGFHPDLTGAENLSLNASLTGLSRSRTKELFNEIVAFAGIGEFIHEPLRTYSSGMVLRLAFAVAIHMDPDILVVDEVLAVGDASFQAKCLQRMQDCRQEGKTLLVVSHATGLAERLCDRAIWLDHGELKMSGDYRQVAAAYSEFSVAAALNA